MLTGLMSVPLFHVIFVTRYEIKSLSPQKKNELSCQMLYCAGGARSSIARTCSSIARHCMSFTIQTNQPDL